MGDVCRLSHDDDRAAERAVFLSAAIDWLFERGHAADLIVAVLAAEFVWLVARGGWPARDAALRLGPAVLMMIALRAALTGAGWPWVALPLALSFPIHLADLRRDKVRNAN